MGKATIKGILARKLRLALTTLAVLLGVAFVSGTYVLTDTMERSFDLIFRRTVTDVDLVVRARDPYTGGGSQRTRIPDTTLDGVRAVDGVATADGTTFGYAQFVDRSGDSIQNGLAPTIGLSWPESEAGPLELADDGISRPPRDDREVLVDEGTARDHGLAVGDRVRVLLQGPAEQFTIVGLFGLKGQADLGGVTVAAFDLPTSERVLASPGALDAIYVTTDPGVSAGTASRDLSAALGPRFEIVPAAQLAEERAEPVRQGVGNLRMALVGFAAVGLVVGSFIIFNTFAILIAQRTRELGLLRALGASRAQVLGSVVLEAVIVGVVAAGLGLAAGIGLARVLLRAVGFSSIGLGAPEANPVVLGRTVVAAVLVGVVVTVASALIPAVRAARTSPVAAINELPHGGSAPLRRRALVGVLVTIAGVGALVLGFRVDATQLAQRVQVVAVGALLAFFGVVMLVAALARSMARVIGWFLSRRGVTGRLAQGNAMRNPRRTAATSAALVVGLSLVCLVAIVSASVKSSIRTGVQEGVRADYILSAQGLTGFSPQVSERVASLPSVEATTGLRLGRVRIGERQQLLVAVDPAALRRVLDLDITAGDAQGLTTGGILVSRDEAEHYGVGPGDRLPLIYPLSGPVEVPVAGVYDRKQFTGGYPVPLGVVSIASEEQNFGGVQQDTLVYVKARPGESAPARRQIDDAIGDAFPNVEIDSRTEFQDMQEGTVDQFVAGLVALLVLSEIIAVLGIINTLLLSVYERTRELGLLRVVGMSRIQVRRMVRGESIIIAVIGCLFGLGLGIFWGWAFTTALREQGLDQFDVPPLQVAVFLVFSVIAGVVAAWLPAWRASRLDVLEAIAEGVSDVRRSRGWVSRPRAQRSDRRARSRRGRRARAARAPTG
ncbi:MAG TPA: ABC transporter permease [Acidimicrobiia bacterium]|nr:ABC transporter permease [Acidimicrobiia bacterium]